jgi:diphosphomevalonate decarboxylase
MNIPINHTNPEKKGNMVDFDRGFAFATNLQLVYLHGKLGTLRNETIMTTKPITAIAHPNIAFIKYWGNRDQTLRLPSNGSISMTLSGLETETSVYFDPTSKEDSFILNEQKAFPTDTARVSSFLDHIRQISGVTYFAEIKSRSNFPISAGLASSASAFAALALAASHAAGLDLGGKDLSRIARIGSGSASRSIFGGFVEWYVGTNHEDSYAEMIEDAGYWDLNDVIAVVESSKKHTGSSQGHAIADSSPFQNARITDAPRRLDDCREAILSKDFERLAMIAEQDSNMMHAVMMTSSPPLMYWAKETLSIMHAISNWRREGIEVFYTIDAGSNVHCICTSASHSAVEERLIQIPGIEETIRCTPGQGVTLKQLL